MVPLRIYNHDVKDDNDDELKIQKKLNTEKVCVNVEYLYEA